MKEGKRDWYKLEMKGNNQNGQLNPKANIDYIAKALYTLTVVDSY